jgi:hypothetical protein
MSCSRNLFVQSVRLIILLNIINILLFVMDMQCLLEGKNCLNFVMEMQYLLGAENWLILVMKMWCSLGGKNWLIKEIRFLLVGKNRLVFYCLCYYLEQGWPTQMILRATLEMHHNSAGHIKLYVPILDIRYFFEVKNWNIMSYYYYYYYYYYCVYYYSYM